MDRSRIEELLACYREGLLGDVLPFWIRHAVDREAGGFLVSLDRDGSVLDTDKALWQQCRFTWLLATLYDTVERNEEWRALAAHGAAFIRRFGFDTDGRMFFLVTRKGRPLRKRRYVFTECFGAAAFAAYAKVSGEERALEEARGLARLVYRHLNTPGAIEPKVDPAVRPMRALAAPMAQLFTAQALRAADPDPVYEEWIDAAIAQVERYHVKPEYEAVLEVTGPEGEFLDHFDGRLLNPGHAVETAWFILEEARHRGGDRRLVALGTTILDWMWKRGWDEEHGGLFYFRDVTGRPVQEYWHDMKFWWPHNEAVIATLLAHHLTGDARYAEMHKAVHGWAYRHFPDPVHGEWFGYLHRDGRLSVPLKGNLWKGPFHLPRMQWYCMRLLEERLAREGDEA